MEWDQAKDLIILGLGTAALHYAKKMADSVQTLNVKVAVILEKLNGHEDRLNRLEGE